MSDRNLVLSVAASEVFGLYWNNRSMVCWAKPLHLFGISQTEDIYRIFEDMCVLAGYPSNYFTSHSGRVGALTGTIAQSVLDGNSLGAAFGTAQIVGDFGVNSDAMRSYVRPLVDRIKPFVGVISHLS